MEKRLKRYLAVLENKSKQETLPDAERQVLVAELLIQIGFFQHERLIHLIVTVTFGVLIVMTLLGLVLSENSWFAVLLLLECGLLVPYIRHYFVLENGVQKLYGYFDKFSSAAA